MTDHPRRRGGRPSLEPGDRSVRICLSIPVARYDDLYARARAARVSIPEQIRRDMQRKDIQTTRPR